METLESIAGLFGFGDKQQNTPARFAEVVSVSGDTVSCTVGNSNVDAVRCCDCAPSDVVLLETMPSGALAAVAVKGYNGGSYTLPPATTSTLGGVIADGTSITVDVDGTIHSTGLTRETSSGGVTWATAITFPAESRGWYEERWSDGRMTRWIWQNFYYNASTRNVTFNPTGTMTQFTDTPRIGLDAVFSGGNSAATIGIKSYTYAGGADSITATIAYFGTTNQNMSFCLRLEGHWR